MRLPTEEEAERWMELARAHGFVDDEGGFALGRYVSEPIGDGAGAITFITPVPAGLEDQDLNPKTPPIMFDRTQDGEIILPGRWWAHTFEQLAELDSVPDDVRRAARLASRHVTISDAHLPADTDTIEILAPDRDGKMVPHEALAPGTQAVIRMRPK